MHISNNIMCILIPQKKDNNIYFGPYTDVNHLRSVVRTLHNLFPIRTCNYGINEKNIDDRKFIYTPLMLSNNPTVTGIDILSLILGFLSRVPIKTFRILFDII